MGQGRRGWKENWASRILGTGLRGIFQIGGNIRLKGHDRGGGTPGSRLPARNYMQYVEHRGQNTGETLAVTKGLVEQVEISSTFFVAKNG